LEVGGELRAITGSSRSGNRLICDFAAIANDELTGSSPGDYLFFENISAACRDGLAVYDFGVGDEPYKRSWCNIETPHLDVWMPLTSRGKLLAATLSAKARLKAQVKHSPAAWRLWKRCAAACAASTSPDKFSGSAAASSGAVGPGDLQG
jgi:CelD/BcsL family acetyltransferase involved in cellulose biosynthesis